MKIRKQSALGLVVLLLALAQPGLGDVRRMEAVGAEPIRADAVLRVPLRDAALKRALRDAVVEQPSEDTQRADQVPNDEDAYEVLRHGRDGEEHAKPGAEPHGLAGQPTR